jgi:hypothetical protein
MHIAGAQTTCNATAPTNAPTCNITLNATVAVAQVLQLTLSTSTPTALAVPLVSTYDSSAAAGSPAAYPVGAVGPTVSVKANRGWNLTISSSSSTWTFAPDATNQLCRVGGGTYPTCTGSSTTVGKAVGDLAFATGSMTGSFFSLSTSTASLGSNGSGVSISYSIFYRVKWLYASDVPGTYTLPVVFTLTGQ